MTQDDPSTTSPPWRFRTGIALFVLGLICPVFVPLVAATGLPAHWKAILSGGLALGIPELLWLAAAAVMGKAGFQFLRQRVFGFLKRQILPEHVGPVRYRIGLVMFLIPILIGWAYPYAAPLVDELTEHRIWIGAGGDVLLLISLFVLGGDFWDKLRALFVYEPRRDTLRDADQGAPAAP